MCVLLVVFVGVELPEALQEVGPLGADGSVEPLEGSQEDPAVWTHFEGAQVVDPYSSVLLPDFLEAGCMVVSWDAPQKGPRETYEGVAAAQAAAVGQAAGMLSPIWEVVLRWDAPFGEELQPLPEERRDGAPSAEAQSSVPAGRCGAGVLLQRQSNMPRELVASGRNPLPL